MIKEHPAMLHYFCGSTDIFICEYDGKDEMFGFSILNGEFKISRVFDNARAVEGGEAYTDLLFDIWAKIVENNYLEN